MNVMGQALYRKYRTTSLSETLGQPHITTALTHAVKTGRISHAYLFTGLRGSGKTSIARIMAYAINGLPYSKEPHLDIIEIDAASNRRIDEIRDLRDKVYIAPTSAKYKVYIIDEVHMLTREAFNALLKTLEEPPAHVVFILATTDVHKLPETIISRTQRYTFRPVAKEIVAEHLAHIAKEESIVADEEALLLLAEHGEGSFRDSISLLDQVSNHEGAVTVQAVQSQLGIPSQQNLQAVTDSLQSGNIAAPVQALQQLYSNGYRAAAIAQQLSKRLRTDLTGGTGQLPASQAIDLLKQLLDVASAHSPERFLELLLMSQVVPLLPEQPARKIGPTPTVSKSANTLAKAPESATPKPTTEVPTKPVKTVAPETVPKPKAQVETPAVTPPVARSNGALQEADWPVVLAELKKQYNTLYGIVRMARLDFTQPGKVGLAFKFAFHQKRIADPKNRTIISDIIAQVSGQQIELVCSVDTEATPTKVVAKSDSLQDISSVFGGGELL